MARPRRFLRMLGPGFITGASDDDPAGIATYSQAGAAFGYLLLWTMPLSVPLMTAVQYVSGAIGGVTGQGLAANLRAHYPRWILYVLAILLFVANTINVGADLGAMAAALGLSVHAPRFAGVAGFGALTFVLIAWLTYEQYARYLKWLTLSLLSYVVAGALAHADWGAALRHALVPSVSFGPRFLGLLVAILGTTISPYLVFWESSNEVEHQQSRGRRPARERPRAGRRELRRLRTDTIVGMAASNLIGFFIVLTVAATLHAHGRTDIQSAADAARALQPFAGTLASWIFAAGIVGTGLLAVPVLAGSAAFALGETFRWRTGLQRTPRHAPAFYGIIAAATALGIGMNLLHVDIIRFLVATAIINGVVELPILFMMLLVARNRRIMGDFVISSAARILGWLTLAVMTAATVGMLATL